MDKIITIVKKPAKMIAMIALFAAAAFGLVMDAADIGGGFMPVVGALVYLVFDLAFLAVVPLLYALKKESLLKYTLPVVFGYWIITVIYGSLQGASVVTKGYAGLSIASGFFRFLIALAMLACLALAILYFFKKQKKFLQIAFCTLAGTLPIFFLVWVLRVAAYAEWKADWVDYFDLIQSYLFLPIGLVFAVLDFLTKGTEEGVLVEAPEVKTEETPAAEEVVKVEDTAAEEVVKEEAAAPEETAPAEESDPQ